MSSRFGRNQKRRMRDLIAKKETELASINRAMAMNKELINRLNNKILDLNFFCEEVAEIVGSASIAAGGNGVPISRIYEFDGDTVDLEPYNPSRLPLTTCGPVEVESQTGPREVLHLLKVEAVRNIVSRQMHIRATLKGEIVQYGISECALMRLPVKILERKLSREIAEALIKQIRK